MIIRPARPSDTEEWLRMRCALWPEYPRGELLSEINAYFLDCKDRAFLVAERGEGM